MKVHGYWGGVNLRVLQRASQVVYQDLPPDNLRLSVNAACLLLAKGGFDKCDA
jgi:hypothetical protein